MQVVTPLERLEAAAVPIAAIGSELVRQFQGVFAEPLRLLQGVRDFDHLKVGLVLLSLLLIVFAQIQSHDLVFILVILGRLATTVGGRCPFPG